MGHGFQPHSWQGSRATVRGILKALCVPHSMSLQSTFRGDVAELETGSAAHAGMRLAQVSRLCEISKDFVAVLDFEIIKSCGW